MYILAIFVENTLDFCEVFESQDNAMDSAILYCENNNVPISITYDDSADGWVVANYGSYFVCIMRRFIRVNKIAADELSSFNTLRNKIVGKTTLQGLLDSLGKPDPQLPSVLAANPAVLSSTIYHPEDNSNDLKLPFGFSHFDFKPMTVEEMMVDPHSVMGPYLLNDAQQLAVVMARVKKRPYICFRDGESGKKYNQNELLCELKNKTNAGINFLNYELNVLDEIYCNVEIPSEDPQAMEESSSYDEESSSEDDYIE